jgi:hypothetical protein
MQPIGETIPTRCQLRCGDLNRLYDYQRTALLGQLYFEKRLATVRRQSVGGEITVALGTSSSVGAWLVFQTRIGGLVWAVLAGGAAVIAIAKPILNQAKWIEKYSDLRREYAHVSHSLNDLVGRVEAKREFTQNDEDELDRQVSQLRELVAKVDEGQNDRIARECQRIVLSRFPTERYWTPNCEVCFS